MVRPRGLDAPYQIVEEFLNSSRTPSGKDQEHPRRQRDDADDRIEYDRMRPRDLNSEEAHLRHALRSEIGNAGDRQGDDAENDEEQSNHREWSHDSCLLKRV